LALDAGDWPVGQNPVRLLCAVTHQAE